MVHSIIGSSESRKVFWTEHIISSLFIGTMEEIPSKISKPAWIGMANLATLQKNPLDLKKNENEIENDFFGCVLKVH